MRPTISVQKTDGLPALKQHVSSLSRIAVYVGIPAADARSRQELVSSFLKNVHNRKRRARLAAATAEQVTNAELLFIHTHGSAIRGIPPRPVLEPAIAANSESINVELSQAAQSMFQGNRPAALRFMKRAGIAGQNAARRWFTDPRRDWPELKPETIERKGSSQELIDTSAMRTAITSVIREG